jgi:hypothetical protein
VNTVRKSYTTNRSDSKQRVFKNTEDNMKKASLFMMFVIFFTGIVVTHSSAQMPAPQITIRQLQEVPLIKLQQMDNLQADAASQNLDWSTYTDDTVSVVGVVLVAPRVLTYTLARYNIYIQDTSGRIWAGLDVLTGDTSAQAQSTLITAADSGYVVRFTGKITEYGSSVNPLTEMFIYNPGDPRFETAVPMEILDVRSRPSPVEVLPSYFAEGAPPTIGTTGRNKFSTGEQYESMYCIVRNVTVTSVDYTTGRFTFADDQGNTMEMYDGSKYFTRRTHALDQPLYNPPARGSKLGYIRGIVLPQSGRYDIMPLYPGDVQVGQQAPSVTTVQRNPGVVTSSDSVKVTFKVYDNNAGGTIDSVFFSYKVGDGSLQRSKVVPRLSDSTASFTIPPQPDGSLVSYYVTSYNHIGLMAMSPDTSRSWRFYRVRNGGMTIYDVQYTPYSDGYPGYVDVNVTVRGIVTTDTIDIPGAGRSPQPRVYLEMTAGGPWSGIYIYGGNVNSLRRGDDVTVTGTVTQEFSRTGIQVSSMTINSRGNQPPAPVVVPLSSVFYQLTNPKVKGDPAAEPWESVLVQFNDVYINNANGDASSNGHYGEFTIATSPLSFYPCLRVDDDGPYTFYCDTATALNPLDWTPPSGGVFLPVGTHLGAIRGIFDYSYSNYKLEPRKNDDFVNVTAVKALPGVAEYYSLSQNYPNPFNPVTNIKYSVPNADLVTLKVFNVLGQEVRTLVNENMSPGNYQVQFDASGFASGVYFYHLQAGKYSQMMKMLLVK